MKYIIYYQETVDWSNILDIVLLYSFKWLLHIKYDNWD
jgi:hypothetical protein